MRARSLLALLAFASLPLGGLAAQGATDARPGVAVFEFENGGSIGQDSLNFAGLQRGIPGMLISELSANTAWRVVEREQVQKLLDEQNLGSTGRVDAQTAAKIGKLVGAKYAVLGTFIDFSGDFRVDIRLVNVETSEIMKTEHAVMSRDKLFGIITDVATRLMKDVNLPPLPKQTADARMSRQVPTEALTYYSRALLYQDRGQKDKAVEMYNKALAVFPEYTEAQQGLERVKNS